MADTGMRLDICQQTSEIWMCFCSQQGLYQTCGSQPTNMWFRTTKHVQFQMEMDHWYLMVARAQQFPIVGNHEFHCLFNRSCGWQFQTVYSRPFVLNSSRLQLNTWWRWSVWLFFLGARTKRTNCDLCHFDANHGFMMWFFTFICWSRYRKIEDCVFFTRL